MIEIRYIEEKDKEFWYSLDRHLPEEEFHRKVRDKRGYAFCRLELSEKCNYGMGIRNKNSKGS